MSRVAVRRMAVAAPAGGLVSGAFRRELVEILGSSLTPARSGREAKGRTLSAAKIGKPLAAVGNETEAHGGAPSSLLLLLLLLKLPSRLQLGVLRGEGWGGALSGSWRALRKGASGGEPPVVSTCGLQPCVREAQRHQCSMCPTYPLVEQGYSQPPPCAQIRDPHPTSLLQGPRIQDGSPGGADHSLHTPPSPAPTGSRVLCLTWHAQSTLTPLTTGVGAAHHL